MNQVKIKLVSLFNVFHFLFSLSLAFSIAYLLPANRKLIEGFTLLFASICFLISNTILGDIRDKALASPKAYSESISSGLTNKKLWGTVICIAFGIVSFITGLWRIYN